MIKEIKVSASILCADFSNLKDDIKKCEDSGVDMLHVDVMDGHFVPNITVGPIIVDAIRPLTSLPIDVHLMIENPGMYIEKFIESGADSLSVHAECYGQLRKECDGFGLYPKEIDMIDVQQVLKDIKLIKAKNKEAFMVLNPGTPFCLQEVLSELDGILVMSVNPGFANQSFMPEVLNKVEEISKVFDGDIAIDGGIKAETAPAAVKAGVNILATASYFFGSKDSKEAVRYLKSLS